MTTTDLTLDLPRRPDASRIARDAVRQRFAAALGPGHLDDLLLMVTELVNNAIVHGQGAVRLLLSADGGRVRGEVVDDGGGFEREVRRKGVDEVGGHGLGIVEHLASRWGIHEGTTHVWFELETHVWFELDSGSGADEATPPALGEARRPSALDDLG